MNSKKSLVAFASILFALVVAGPVAAACDINNPSTCTNADLIALLSSLQTQTTTGTAGTANVTACQGVTFTRNLTLGSTGSDVKCLQAFLNQSADTQVAATGVGSAQNETTYFGVKTQTAVKAFQTKYGITPVYGFVGSITRAKLNELLSTVLGTGTATYPAGCTSATGYSPTTGLSCSGTVVTTLPAGCTSATGYSPTTGQSCAGTGTGTTVVAGQPLTVALAADTPVGGNILTGEANKTVTRVTLTAGADADATVSTLKVKSFGTAALTNTDITAVKVYSNGSQVGTTQSMVSGVATFTFAPALTITKGTAKNLDIIVSIASNTTAYSATVKMGILDATAIGGGTTFTGTFPVVGNAYSIVAGGSLGTVSVTNGIVVPVTAVGSGTKDVELGNFVVSAGTNEDVSIKQFVVTYLGTPTDGPGSAILDTDVNNIRVVVDGVVQGTSAAFSSRKTTVNFTTPLVISRGAAKTLKVLGDVISGAGRVIELQADIDSVSGNGVTSGVGIAGPATALSAGATNEIAINKGSLSVSVSSATPQGTAAQYVKSTSAQTLGVFDIRAVGEDILVSSLGFTITGPASVTGTITSVGLYNEAGGLISSNLVNFDHATDWDSSPIATEYFNLSATIPANTTQKFYVKGITNGITAPDPVSIVVSLVNNLNSNTVSIIGTGMNSSAQQGSYNITLASTAALPAVSVNQGPTATISGDPSTTPLNQSVMSPASQVTVGTVKVTAQREDQTLRSIVLTGVPSTSTIAGLLTTVALYDGATQVTNFVAPSANTVTFSGTDVLSPAVTFVKGTAKVLKVVANTAGSITGTNFYFTIAATTGHLTTVGKTSGQLFQSAAAVDLRVSSGSTAAGTYTLNPIIVEVVKDAASPSGTVGRGTYSTYATYKLDSYGTTSDVNVTSVTFYSKVGLPTGAVAGMFRLVDADSGEAIVVGTTTVSTSTGTVQFDMDSGELAITNGVSTRLNLQITTTNTTAWAANTAMQWTITPSSSVTLAETGAAVGSSNGVNYSIPADANLVNIGA